MFTVLILFASQRRRGNRDETAGSARGGTCQPYINSGYTTAISSSETARRLRLTLNDSGRSRVYLIPITVDASGLFDLSCSTLILQYEHDCAHNPTFALFFKQCALINCPHLAKKQRINMDFTCMWSICWWGIYSFNLVANLSCVDVFFITLKALSCFHSN